MPLGARSVDFLTAAGFLARYPKTASEAIPLDARTVASMAEGFELVAQEEFRIGLSYRWEDYASYMMTETNVAAAIRRAETEDAIRGWLKSTLPVVFGAGDREVIFPGY